MTKFTQTLENLQWFGKIPEGAKIMLFMVDISTFLCAVVKVQKTDLQKQLCSRKSNYVHCTLLLAVYIPEWKIYMKTTVTGHYRGFPEQY